MVQALRGARYRSTVLVQSLERARYSNSQVWALRRARYAGRRLVQRLRGARYASSTAAAEAAWRTGDVADGEFDLVDIKVDVQGTRYDLTGVPSSLTETQGESESARWQLSIVDDTGEFHPERVGGPWQGVMDAEAFGPSGEYRKRLLFWATWGGVPYHLEGVPTKYGHSRSFSTGGRFEFNWSGLDISRKLFLGGQTFPTLRTTRDSYWTTKSAVADLLTRVGIPFDLSRMDDAPIRVQHRQNGRPGDWFQALMDVLGTEWLVIDGVLVCYQPAYVGPPHFEYQADDLIQEDTLDEDAPEIVNRVIAKRAAETQAMPPLQLLQFRQYRQDFNPPLSYVTYQLESGGDVGVVSDVYLRDPDGNIVAVRDSRSGNYPPAALGATAVGIGSAELSWGVKQGGGAFTEWPGTLRFRGQSFDSPALQETYDQDFTIVEVDQASIDKYGEHTVELSPNPLIFDSGTLRRSARAYLAKRAGRKPETWRVPLNHAIRPGHRVRIHDSRLGTSHVRYVRRRSHSWHDNAAQRFTRLETLRYA